MSGRRLAFGVAALALLLLCVLWVVVGGGVEPEASSGVGAAAPSGTSPGSGRDSSAAAPAGDLPPGTSAPPATGKGDGAPGGNPEPGAARGRIVRVCDLATGKPVPLLEFVVESGDRSSTAHAATDGDGVLEIPPVDGGRLAVVDTQWRIVGETDGGEGAAAPTLWLAGRVNVRGRVVPEPAASRVLDLASVRLNVVATGLPEERISAPSRLPWTTQFLETHGVAEGATFSRITDDGRFTLSIARSRGVVVTATAPGYRPACADVVDADGVGADRELVLVLRSSRRVRGIVRSADGTPVAGAQVAAHVITRAPAADVNPERLRLAGHPVKTRVDGPSGLATLVHVREGRTGGGEQDGGAFALDLAVDGETVITVWPSDPSLAPARVVLAEGGGPDGDVPIEIVLAAAPPAPTLRLLVDGLAVADAGVSIADISDVPAQPTFMWRLSAAGEMATHLLVRGREYLAYVHAERREGFQRRDAYHGRFVWEGQREVNLVSGGGAARGPR